MGDLRTVFSLTRAITVPVILIARKPQSLVGNSGDQFQNISGEVHVPYREVNSSVHRGINN